MKINRQTYIISFSILVAAAGLYFLLKKPHNTTCPEFPDYTPYVYSNVVNDTDQIYITVKIPAGKTINEAYTPGNIFNETTGSTVRQGQNLIFDIIDNPQSPAQIKEFCVRIKQSTMPGVELFGIQIKEPDGIMRPRGRSVVHRAHVPAPNSSYNSGKD